MLKFNLCFFVNFIVVNSGYKIVYFMMVCEFKFRDRNWCIVVVFGYYSKKVIVGMFYFVGFYVFCCYFNVYY